MDNQEYDSNHPEVIQAKAEAQKKIIEARSQLHPVAQAVYAIFDSLDNTIRTLGCLIILAIIILALFAPTVLQN